MRSWSWNRRALFGITINIKSFAIFSCFQTSRQAIATVQLLHLSLGWTLLWATELFAQVSHPRCRLMDISRLVLQTLNTLSLTCACWSNVKQTTPVTTDPICKNNRVIGWYTVQALNYYQLGLLCFAPFPRTWHHSHQFKSHGFKRAGLQLKRWQLRFDVHTMSAISQKSRSLYLLSLKASVTYSITAQMLWTRIMVFIYSRDLLRP